MSDGKKTALAERMIVRYIWDRELKPGDKLPSCAAISESTGLGAATVFSAVKKLQAEGVLKAKDKVGVFVRNPDTPGLAGYRVAQLIGRRETSPYNAFLAVYLQTEFAKSGCLCRMFPGDYEERAETNLLDGFKAHRGFLSCLKRKEFDGIVIQMLLSPENMKHLEMLGIPVCFAGGFQQEGLRYFTSVSLDFCVESGAKRLDRLGAKSPLFLAPNDWNISVMEKKFRSILPNGSIRKAPHFSEAEKLAEELLALPKEKRPDSMLILDDMLARGFYSSLVRKNGLAWLPHPVVLSAREYPLYLPLPADVLEMSLEKNAKSAVELLKDAMRAPSTNPKTVLLNPVERFLEYKEKIS